MTNIKQYQPPTDNRSKGAAMAEEITKLFQALRASYPRYGMVMKTEKQELGMMREWGVALAKAGINREMLGAGVARSRSYAMEDKFCYWPSIGEFITWCHGLPDANDAYMETVRKMHSMEEWEPSHPAVALVFEVINLHDFKKMDAKQARGEYVRAYGKVSARVLQGEVLEYAKPEQIKRIESVQTPEKRESGLKSLSELKTMLGTEEKKKSEPLIIDNIEERKAAVAAMGKRYLEQRGKNNDSK